MKLLKFLFFTFCGIFATMYFVYVTYLYFNQTEMVFIKSSLNHEYKFNFQIPFQEKYITSFDGKKQHGLLFTVQNPKGIIFYLHGMLEIYRLGEK